MSGRRVRHYKPLAFLLVTTSIYVLAHYFLEKNTFFYDAALGMQMHADEVGSGADKIYINWVSKYQVYIPLMVLPVYAASTYLAFYRLNYNYFEHLVINFYITGQQMLIYWIFGYLFLEENGLLIVPMMIGMVYNFWTFNQIFDTKKTLTKVGLIILSYMIFIVGSSLIIFASGYLFGRFF